MIIRYDSGDNQFMQQHAHGQYVRWDDYALVANMLRRLWSRRSDGLEDDYWAEWDEAHDLLIEQGILS